MSFAVEPRTGPLLWTRGVVLDSDGTLRGAESEEIPALEVGPLGYFPDVDAPRFRRPSRGRSRGALPDAGDGTDAGLPIW